MKYGKWTVEDPARTVRVGKRPFFEARCDCGTVKLVRRDDLVSGKSTSCGCANIKHHLYKHPLYNTWTKIRDRCNNPFGEKFKDYGGRGVQICARWDDFAAFVEDVGPRPDGHTLDRIDVNGNYEPGNVRWATIIQQNRNRRCCKK